MTLWNDLIIFYGGMCIEFVYNEKTKKNVESVQVFNDLFILDINESHWSRSYIAGTIPGPRYSIGFTFGFRKDSGQTGKLQESIILIGGIEHSYKSMDVYCLD